MPGKFAATALVLVAAVQLPVFSQNGTESCFIDLPTIAPPTAVFSDHIIKTSNNENFVVGLTIEDSSVSFEGGTVELNSTDTATIGIAVSGGFLPSPPFHGRGALVFENGAVELTHRGSDRIHGLVIDETSAAHFKDGTISVSSTEGSFIHGVTADGEFVMDGGTINVTAGEDVFQPTGIVADWRSTVIINGGTIRVDGGLESNVSRGIDARGHPFDPSRASTVIINGGTIEVMGGRRPPGRFLEVGGSADVCIFGGSVGEGSNEILLDDSGDVFIFGTGFNHPTNVPITASAGTISGTLLDGSDIRWTFRRRRHDGTLMLVSNFVGDFNSNGALETNDLDLLAIQQVSNDPDLRFDITGDGNVDIADRDSWLSDYRRTWFGDFNLDGLFDSEDIVQTFVRGKYDLLEDATFAEGDANGDLRFDSHDLARSLAGGGYETGERLPESEGIQTVPEPSGIGVIALPFVLFVLRSRGKTV